MSDIMLSLGPYGVYLFRNAEINKWKMKVDGPEVIRGVGLKLSTGPSHCRGELSFSSFSDAFAFPSFDDGIRDKKVKDCTALELFFAVRARGIKN